MLSVWSSYKLDLDLPVIFYGMEQGGVVAWWHVAWYRYPFTHDPVIVIGGKAAINTKTN